MPWRLAMLCWTCWDRIHGRAPGRVQRDAPVADCASCGTRTVSGIWIHRRTDKLGAIRW